MNSRKKVIALLLTVSMVLAPGAGAVAAAPGASTDDASATDNVTFEQGVVDPTGEVTFTDEGEIDPALTKTDGTTTAVVRLDNADQSQIAQLDSEASVDALKSHAATSQQSFLRFASQRDGIEVQERFWIVNAVVIEIDTNEVQLQTVSRIKSVDRIHQNFEVNIPEPDQQRLSDERVDTDNGVDTTYGLDQINAPELWSEFNTKGEGIDVAVLDTGVDPDHPDINIQDDHFVQADSDGNVENVAPFDDDGHGTHVSGTVAGGNASGEYIGVAPGATLWHGKVLGSDGGGSFAQIAGGMEWAAGESEIDVVSMSLGASGYFPDLIEPVQNLEAAGKIVVSSSGNSGAGSSGTPGNIYEVMAIGASNEAGDIASFSSGETVDTSSAWGSDAPSDWPDEYTVPDYAAPGADVKSAQNGGGYTELSGTSMAAPHFAGAMALMLAAGGESLDKTTIQEALTDTATAPPNADPTRYGDGIIDVQAAAQQVSLSQSVSGVVTDSAGNAVPEATVTTSQGFETVTDKEGGYTVLAEPGEVQVNVSGFGINSVSETVQVTENETTTLDINATATVDVAALEPQPESVEGGEDVSVTVDAANVESYSAELANGFDQSNATLYVDGTEVPFGTTIEFGQPVDGPVTVTVETADGSSGELSVVHTFGGLGESLEVTTGPTDVFSDLQTVGVVDDNNEYGSDIASTLGEQLPGSYEVDVVDSQTAIDSVGTYDAFVVQNIDDANAAAFADATSGYDAGAVYLDQYGTGSNGIEARSAAIDDPAETNQEFSGDNPYLVNYPADHPLFEDVAGGEPIQLHAASFADRTTFGGTDAAVLGEIASGADGASEGSGLAVDEERWDILAASLGYTSFLGASDYTTEADILLGNAVEVAANPPGPAGEISVTNETIAPSENTTVSLQTTADNVSGYEVTLTFDPQKLQVTGVSGVDMADPVVNLDNDAGELVLTQAQATSVDGAEFARIDFDTTAMEKGESATVDVAGPASDVYDTNGSAYISDASPGEVDVLQAELGDVNADGEVTAGDAVIVQRYIAGLPTETPDSQVATLADLNEDGAVTSADVTAILQLVANGESNDQQSSVEQETTRSVNGQTAVVAD